MSKRSINSISILVLALLVSACVTIQPPTEMSGDAAADAKIEEAMRAAPSAISAEATIVEWPDGPGSEMVVLREGTNRWSCTPAFSFYPDDVGKPICMDDVWLAFMKARLANEEFAPVTTPGIAYMLDGGGGPSISDPFLTEPAPGDNWIKGAPPHLMILTPGDISDYPRTPGPEPWNMFPDTPFAHLMVTVLAPVEAVSNTELDPKFEEAMRAAPSAISAEATIVEWPDGPGSEMVVLREGTNRWTCTAGFSFYPEGIGKPICMDDVWLAFMKARLANEELSPITTPGIAYMLDGGGGPSISDPFATEPAPDGNWIKDAPPHLMILTPGDISDYPRTPGPEPWHMFPDTSFAHLMVTVPLPE